MNETELTKKCVVGIGSVCAEQGNAELVAYAIGSCVALCLYDPGTEVGAMAHILLPAASFTGHENTTDMSTKYADHALQSALEKMYNLGAEKFRISAAIVGGAVMFPHGNTHTVNIGEMNILSVSQELERIGIPIVYSLTGGNKSRTVLFRLRNSGFENQLIVKSPKL